jgi:hypothetical protein
MAQPETIPNSTRRGFLSGPVAAAGGAVIATATPAMANQPDTEIIAAGQKFEALFTRYMPAWFEWARLHREAMAETEAKFGEDYSSPAWREPSPGQSPAQLFLHNALARNGTDMVSDVMDTLHQEMEPIANFIRNEEVESLAGLRVKALVAIWDSRPICATHSGCLNLEEEWSLYSLLTGVVAVTGLSDLFGAFVERVESDATEILDVG